VAYYDYLFRLLHGREPDDLIELAELIGFTQRVKKRLIDKAVDVLAAGIGKAFTKK
jgi:hypothetical protein